MTRPPAPRGVKLVGDDSLRVEGDGRTIVGGSPLRILRLSEAGRDRLDRWMAGEPVGDSLADRSLARRLLDAGLVHPVPIRSRRGDGGHTRVSVVVPVRDDPTGLDRLLTSLAAWESDPEVIVVDDGSRDGVSHERVTTAAGGTYLRLRCSGGPGVARNAGLELTGTELVVLLDADVVLETGRLDDLMAHFDDPCVAAVAPRVRSRRGRSGVLAAYEELHSPLDLGPSPSSVGPGRRVAYVPAACLAVRTAALHDLGGFDPALRWGEDVDLVWRLSEAGHTVRYEPSVTVAHEPRRDLREWIRQRRRYGYSAAPLAARHPSAVAPVRLSAWSASAWAAAFAGHPVLGLGLATGSTAALVPKLEHLPGGTRLAVRLAGLGHLYAGVGLLHAATRAWWPVTVALGMARRKLAPSVVAAFLVPPFIEWVQGARPAGPIRTVALRVADDLAYGWGVWEGMVKARSWAAVRPDLVVWPDRGAVDGCR